MPPWSSLFFTKYETSVNLYQAGWQFIWSLPSDGPGNSRFNRSNKHWQWWGEEGGERPGHHFNFSCSSSIFISSPLCTEFCPWKATVLPVESLNVDGSNSTPCLAARYRSQVWHRGLFHPCGQSDWFISRHFTQALSRRLVSAQFF